MKNRKQRYKQKVYKYQDQQRVPECFEDDPECFEDIYDVMLPLCFDYDPVNKTCGNVYCKYCSRYLNWDDWISVDSNPKGIYKNPVQNEINYAAAVVEKHSLANNNLSSLAEAKNRYAVLGDEEGTFMSTVVDKKERLKICLNRVKGKQEEKSFKEDMLNEELVEGESEWKVYQSKSSMKRAKWINRTESRIESETTAHKQRLKEIEQRLKEMEQRLKDTQKWIDSCQNDETNTFDTVSNDDDLLIINTDGFFRRNRKAGYGVIIRTRSGVPIVASAGFYNHGKPVSALYHELQGINRGLELAIKYGLCNDLIVYCSSYVAADLVGSRFSYCMCVDRHQNIILKNVCGRCIKSHDPDCSENDFWVLMYPLVQEIVENSSMVSFSIFEIRRRQNNAADYLAKLGLNKEEIIPHEFPEELKCFLYEDARGGDMMPCFRRRRPCWFSNNYYELQGS